MSSASPPPVPLPGVLAELVQYFGPLAAVRRELAGAALLHTPSVNVLALNAAFLPDSDPRRLPPIAAWQRARGEPALVATTGRLPGEASPAKSPPAEEVAALRVGTCLPPPGAGSIVVEQVSRLSLPLWTAVLAEAHGTPEWAAPLARHLAARLEGDSRAVLLLAYAGGEAVGALLWRAEAEGGGGSAHLWGTLDPGVDAPLLNAAGELGGRLRVSLPDHSPVALVTEEVVRFLRLADREA